MAKYRRWQISAATGARFSWTSRFLRRDRPTRLSWRSNEYARRFGPMPHGPRSWWTGLACSELKHLGRAVRRCDYNSAQFPAVRTMPHANCAAGFKIASNRNTSDGAGCSAWKLSEVKHSRTWRRDRVLEGIPGTAILTASAARVTKVRAAAR